jgi:hypothetical protein
MDALGYQVQQEFEIDFGNDQKAKCIALEPPEKRKIPDLPWKYGGVNYLPMGEPAGYVQEIIQEYHMPPELFVSDGTEGSIVGNWVAARGGVGGIHHIAYQVESVAKVMEEWKEKGYAEFTSEQPMRCPGLTQVFTKPSELTGVIYEFIERGEHGFCKDNVKDLMSSTAGL